MGVTGPAPDVWVHPAVEVRPSAIHGDGLFAGADLPAGTVVVRLGGRLVSSAELDRLLAAAAAGGGYVDCLTVGEDRHLVLPPGTVAHHGNHSCDPTLWHDGPYALATRRPVAAGEELTLDYGTNSGLPGFRMPCTCRSALCRGEVTGDDWRRPELRARYGDHWTPALLARIAAAGPA